MNVAPRTPGHAGAPAAELLKYRALRTWVQMHMKQGPDCSLGVESFRPWFKPCLGPWHLWELRPLSQTSPHVTPLGLSFPHSAPCGCEGRLPSPTAPSDFEWILFLQRISL